MWVAVRAGISRDRVCWRIKELVFCLLLDSISACAQRVESLLLRGGTIGLAHRIGGRGMFERSGNTCDVVAGTKRRIVKRRRLGISLDKRRCGKRENYTFVKSDAATDTNASRRVSTHTKNSANIRRNSICCYG